MLADAALAPASPGAITILGSGRLGPTAAALLGLAAAVLAVRALARARRPEGRAVPGPSHQRRAPVLLGVVAMLLGGVFLAAADGGPGTGIGVVGSAVAIALGGVAIVLDRYATMQEGRSPS